MNPTTRIIKNALSNLTRGGASALVAILLPAFLTRHMSSLSYGVWTLILQVAAYVGYLDFGLQTAIGRFVAYANEKQDSEMRDSIFSTAFAALCGACFVSLICVAGAVVFAGDLFPTVPPSLLPSMRGALAMVATALAVGLPASSWNGIFVGLERNEIPALTIGGAKLASAAAIGIISSTSDSLIAMATGMALINLASYVAQYLMLRSVAPQVRLRWNRVRRSTARELGEYCFSLTIWSFCMMLVSGLDLYLVSRFEFSQVASYSVASSLVTFIAGAQSAIFSALMPQAASMQARGDVSRLGDLLTFSTRTGVVLLVLSGLPLAIFAGPILHVWVGTIYAAAAQNILKVLLIANVIRLVWVPYGVFLVGTGQQRLVLASPLAEALINLLASILLGLHYGAIGVALGTLIGAVVGSLVNLTYSLPRTNVYMDLTLRKFVVGGLAVPAIVSLPLLMLAAFHTLQSEPVPVTLALISSLTLAALVLLSAKRLQPLTLYFQGDSAQS